MQNLPIYLYDNQFGVTLDLDSSVRGVNQIMYQRDLTIQKGIKNKFRIQFRNSDQKRIHIHNTQTFVFSMFDSFSNRLVVEKRLSIIDSGTTGTKGLAALTLTESDTIDLDNTSYKYSVKLLDSDGSYVPAYANTYYGVSGTIHIHNDVYPVLQPSQIVTDFQKSFNAATNLYEHKSGNIYAYPEFNGNTALHTVAMYMTAFRGTVYVQGTLSNTPDSTGKYATLATRTYTGFTGIDYVNFNGVFTYVRLIYVPAKAPAGEDNDDPTYYGRFDKLLYRC
jgi:hypothetical protein